MDLVLQLQRTMDRVVGIESLHDDVTGGGGKEGGFEYCFFLLLFYECVWRRGMGKWDICPFSTNSAGLGFYLLCGDGSNY